MKRLSEGTQTTHLLRTLVLSALLPCVTIASAQSTTALAERQSDLRYGDNGAPPGANGAFATELPAPQWRVGYDTSGMPQTWERLGKADSDGDVLSLKLTVDAAPPQASLRFNGAMVETAQGVVLGPDADIAIEASDPSGGVSAELRVDGKPLAAGAGLSDGRDDGSYRLSVWVSDALGNSGETGVVDVQLDRTPPTLSWRRLDAKSEVADDIFDGKRARLAIDLLDEGAGVKSLRLGDNEHAAVEIGNAPLEVEVSASSLEYSVVDRVGNDAGGRIALRADTEGPVFIARRNGQPFELGNEPIRRTDSIQLSAEDALAGVARACVETSIWFGDCRELPLDLVGIAPGRYRLEFRASDHLGNRRISRFAMEVLP